jgi:hypothetical protein
MVPDPRLICPSVPQSATLPIRSLPIRSLPNLLLSCRDAPIEAAVAFHQLVLNKAMAQNGNVVVKIDF